MDVVRSMLSILSPAEGQVLVDLGCGDGRILMEATRSYGCHAVGVEKNKRLAEYCYRRLSESNVKNFRIVRGNLFDFDVGKADFLTLYLTTDALSLLRPKLELTLRPGARVASHDFPVPGWRPLEEVFIRSIEDGRLHRVCLYEAGRSFKSAGKGFKDAVKYRPEA